MDQDVLLATKLDAKQRSILEVILNSSQNMLRLVNDILDFNKIEAGKLKVRFIELPYLLAS